MSDTPQDPSKTVHCVHVEPSSFVAGFSTLTNQDTGATYPQVSIHITGEAEIARFKSLILNRAFNCIWEDLPTVYRDFADMVMHGGKQPSNRDMSEADRQAIAATRAAQEAEKPAVLKAPDEPVEVELSVDEVERIRNKFKPAPDPQPEFVPVGSEVPPVTLDPNPLPSVTKVFGIGKEDVSDSGDGIQDLDSREVSLREAMVAPADAEAEVPCEVQIGSTYIYNRTGAPARVVNVGLNGEGKQAVEFEVDSMGTKKTYQQPLDRFLKDFRK